MKRKWTDPQLTVAVKSSVSVAGVLRKLDLGISGGNYETIKLRIRQLGLCTRHFTGQGWSRGKMRPRIPLDALLVEGSSRNGTDLKKRLIKAGLLKNECSVCGINEWCGEALSLERDHINGVRSDNRLENLRLLCPNCHSQTPTYCRRNTKYVRRPKCVDCRKRVDGEEKRCESCIERRRRAPRKTKIGWPATEELVRMVAATSFLATGRTLGVSDNAVRKRIRNYS